MKKIFYILAVMTAALSMSSCGKDFLKQDKPLSLTEDMVFEDAGFIESDLLGCYYSFKRSNPTFMGGLGFVVFDNRGDDIVNVSNPITMQDTYEMSVLSTTIENSRIWDCAYGAINDCNLFIDKLVSHNCAEALGEELCNQFTAEAKFIRAYCYYVLCNLYSQPYCIDSEAPAVPLRLKGLEASGNNDCPKSSIGEIYNQILEDCQPDALPDGAGEYDGVSRASKAAAHLLRMRVYMAMEQWEDAIAEGEAISGYKLADDVTSLYGKDDVYSNGEMIFALPAVLSDKPNTQMSAAEYFSPQAGIVWLDAENGILAQPGYCLAADARIANLVSEPDANGYVYSTKYSDFGGHCDWLPLMRYAEVKLNLAECYANLADGAAKAKSNLADVRSRSIASSADIIDVNSLSGGNLKIAVYNERRLEFICEGIRGIDIMRRGESFVKDNSFVSINVGSTSAFYTWPIPDAETTYNKAL